MKYDIVFLSRIIPPEIEDEVRSKMVGLMEDAAMAWQWHMIEGIESNNDGPVQLLNYLPVNAYPNTYKAPFIRKLDFFHDGKARDVNLGYCNIKYIKRFFQWIPLHRELKRWLKQDNGLQKVLVAYTMYPEFMGAIKFAKKLFPNIITINIVVDMPQFTVLSKKKKSFLNRCYSNWENRQAYGNIRNIDGFVTITKQMAEELSAETPYQIVEGLCTTEFPQKSAKGDNVKKIVYAGKLHEKFGVLNLLDAFAEIEDPDIELLICGIGEAEEEVRMRQKQDKRINFLGKLKRDEVLQLLVDADVIVNPRQNNGEYTKYSFPSKNIEALSSGVPFIGYKLDGIPDEYDKYMNCPEDDSAESLSSVMNQICNACSDQYLRKAALAKEWVCREKSCFAQGQKVFRLINEIIGESRDARQQD